MDTWKKAQQWEKDWHGDCVNSLNEELKQLVYAQKMGLEFTSTLKTPYSFDLENKSILDIGGGAYSLLLKCINFKTALIIDPIQHPDWVYSRYKEHKVDWLVEPAEIGLKSHRVLSDDEKYDEVWIYNVLQHTQDPQVIIQNARKMSKLIRVFEWIDTPVNIGHIHTLKQGLLDRWLFGEGQVEHINQNGCVGRCYYGIFPV